MGKHKRGLVFRVSEWVSLQGVDQVLTACHSRGVPAAPFLEVDRALSHSHARERQMVVELALVEVGATTFGSPLKLSRTPARMARAMGPPGESN